MQPFEHTYGVNFELSNRCPMAAQHARCPLSRSRGVRTLPASIVENTLHDLGAHGFTGRIAFHNYNEPLVDPRLFIFIGLARDLCPKAPVYILTNGWALDQILLDEMAHAGVRAVQVSAYSDAEHDRIVALQAQDGLKFDVRRVRGLDDRINIYDHGPEHGRGTTCHAPLQYVVIDHKGRVGLCCYDWGSRHVFGDLSEERLSAVLVKPEVLDLYARLSAGDRCLPICKACKSVDGK